MVDTNTRERSSGIYSPRLGEAVSMLLKILRNALASGTAATVTSTAGLAAMAVLEEKGPAQPLNATSHMLYGDEAANFRDADADHTIIGLTTHAAATIFWATAFEASLALRPTRDPMAIAGRAASIGLLAAVVDYTTTPKRFTLGWELMLTKKSVAIVYGAMAAAFAGVALRRS